MTKKTRKQFTQDQRNNAVDDYLSGARSANQIAEDLGTDVQTIYRWKTVRSERDKGLRVEELMSEGNSQAMAEALLNKELEIEMYQKKIAEQSIIIDLLKKLPGNENFQSESELTGLIKTTKKSDQKRKRVKR
jgi:transposase-like protein